MAHVSERIAADRFMAEIGTLPCTHRRRVGEASGQHAARVFETLGAPIVQHPARRSSRQPRTPTW